MSMYLITGANGFVGNNLIREINAKEPDATIRALIQPGTSTEPLNGLKCDIYEGDITVPESLVDAFTVSPDDAGDGIFVIHCAGIIDISSKPNPKLHEVNVVGTANVAEATQNMGKHSGSRPRFIEVASVHAIPEAPHGRVMTEPQDYSPNAVVGQYAKSKAEAAHLILERIRSGALEGCIVLPSGIIGPYDFSPENMKHLIAEVADDKLRACVKGGYDFTDVRDVSQGILGVCKSGRNGESYILSNRQVPIKEICNEARAFVGRPPMRIVLPIWLAKIGVPFCEMYYRLRKKVPLFTRYALHTLESNSLFSHAKASSELGYVTRPVKETVDDMMSWMGIKRSTQK